MPAKPFNLTDKQRRFIADEIKAGHYHSENEVVQAGLDLLEKQTLTTLQRQALLKEIQIGIDQLDAGLGITLRTEEELHRFMQEIGKKALLSAKKKKKRV